MTDEDPKPGVVIDVTPEPEPAPAEPAEEAPPSDSEANPKSAQRASNLPLILGIIALLAVIAAVAVGYNYWGQLRTDLAAIETRVAENHSQQRQLQQSISTATGTLLAQQGKLDEQRELLVQQRAAVDEARAAFELQEQKLAEENLRLQEREAELRAAVTDVHRRVGRSGTQWMIAEAEYLLRIANDRLILARDSETARVALELADQRLRDTKDPGWAGVREQIARDIAKLSAFEAPDIAGLSLRLGALIEQIPQLKIASATIGPERTLPEQVAREPGERSWDTLFEDIWAGFKDSVRIRERDKPVQAMLAPEHQFFLYENLKLHLQAARLALARGDQPLMREHLGTAADWLKRYFAPEDGAAASIGQAIAEMIEIDIRPSLPDVSQSLRALQVRQKLMQEIAPSGMDGNGDSSNSGGSEAS
jgi:uroporphyrin-3 C-methyltransferase